MKKMIVTGSEGFIGKALCQQLKSEGVDVIGIDRKNGTEAEDIGEYLRMGEIDCVFHLAAQTSVFNDDIVQIRKDNIDTFITVVNECKKYGVKLVYASSSTANPANTTSMYGISKHFCEQYASVYYPQATGCRLHNVYGKDQREGTLLWYLTNKRLVNLYNYGQNVRCFTYLDDVVQGLTMARLSTQKLINIANVQPVTTEYFSKLVSSFNGVVVHLSGEKKDFDNLEQSVNKDVFLLPLSYTSVEDGIKKIFNGKR